MSWYRAYTILNIATLLRSEGWNEKVKQLLEEARDEFIDMGAQVYAEEIQAELKTLEG